MNATNYSELSFNDRRAALKSMGFDYADYAKLKKDELIPLLESGKPSKGEILKAHESNFENKGGKVIVCKPGKEFSTGPANEKVALKKKRTLKKVIKSAKSPSSPNPVEPSSKRDKKVPVKSEGVLLKSLIRDLNISGTDARKALRTSGIVKPSKQWIWPEGHPDLAKVKELLTGLGD